MGCTQVNQCQRRSILWGWPGRSCLLHLRADLPLLSHRACSPATCLHCCWRPSTNQVRLLAVVPMLPGGAGCPADVIVDRSHRHPDACRGPALPPRRRTRHATDGRSRNAQAAQAGNYSANALTHQSNLHLVLKFFFPIS